MGANWLGRTQAAALFALAIGAPALAQPADPDGPLPTARYERPPAGVDPGILSRPLPEPASPSVEPPAPVAGPTIVVPEAPTVRRRGVRAPASLETPTAAPQERPWERPAVGARAPDLQPVPAPEPRPARAAAPSRPAGRMIELQVGAFADRANAERAARSARMAGPTRIHAVTVGGVTYHRVIVGPASETGLRATLEKLGFPDAKPLRP